MAEYSPTRRRSSVEGLSHQQTVEMHEQLLDMQTQEPLGPPMFLSYFLFGPTGICQVWGTLGKYIL